MPSNRVILGGFFMNGLKFNEEQSWYEMVEGQIGYEFENRDLLTQAFVRKSYSMEKGGQNNEVLEFIGDRSLDMIVTKMLMEQNGFMVTSTLTEENEDGEEEFQYNEFCCDIPEGSLTELKSQLVRRDNLASRIDDMDLAKHLIMGKGDEKNKVNEKASVKEDLFEAIVGAITIDSDWDFEEIQEAIEVMLNPDLILSDNEVKKNYVKLVQDWLSEHYNTIPMFAYEYLNGSRLYSSYMNTISYGYNHKPIIVWFREEYNPYGNRQEYQFECRMKLTDDLPEFGAYGTSKSEARKKACQAAYEYLENEELLWTIQDEIQNPNKAEAISQLEILARRGYFEIPEYDFREQYDKNGNPVWDVACYIKGISMIFRAEATSKKEAKKLSAYKMLMYVLYDEE